MSNFKYWFQKGSYSFINRILMFVLGFSGYLFLVRYLDKSDFGIYNIYLIITGIVELGRRSFLQNGFTKYYHLESNKKNEIITNSLMLNIIWTAFSSLVLILSANSIGNSFNSKELSNMMSIYGYLAFLDIPTSQLSIYFSATMNFKAVTFISNGRNLFYFFSLVIIFFFFKDLTVYHIAILNIAGIGFSSLIGFFFYGHVEKWKFLINKKLMLELFHFGKYTLGVGLTGIATRSIDQLMIGYFISANAVASYNIARRFTNIIDVPITAISNVAFPKMAKAANMPNANKELVSLYEKSSGYCIAAITPFVLPIFLFPDLLIKLVAGEEYLDAIPLLQILLSLTLLKPMAIQAGGFLEASGKPKIGFILLLINTFINIFLTYFFINLEGSYGGVIGAAIASFISRIIHLSILFYFISREGNFSVANIFKSAFLLYINTFKMIKNKIIAK